MPSLPSLPSLSQLASIPAAALLALACAAPACADTSPWYVGAGLSYNHVSNIFRQTDNANSDNVWTASLLAGLDQRLGRQRLYGDATLQTNRYASNSDLNNQSYSLKGGLDWSTLERLSGTLSASSTRALASYNVGSGITPIFKKNIEDNRVLEATAQLGLVTKFTFDVGAQHRERDFSATEYASQEYSQNRYTLGFSYKPSPDLRLSIAGRHTEGEFPNYVLNSDGSYANNAYKRNDIDLMANWTVTGNSYLFARVSTGRGSQSYGDGRRITGNTGQLSWTWTPTGKLTLTTTLIRDTGLESSFINLGSSSLSTDLDRLTTGLQLNATYALSSKLSLVAGANLSRSDRNTVLSGLGSDDERDNDRAYNLGARWQYSRAIQLGCQMTRQSRSSTTALYSYSANSYGCYGQFILN